MGWTPSHSEGRAEQSHSWLCHRTDIEEAVSDVLQDQVIATPDPGGVSVRHGNADLISVSLTTN
jgi:hypothetical protein